MPREVFISFASKDRETVERIMHGLEARNVSCWMSTRDIPPGADFQEAIINALEQAKVMLLVFSTNANNSSEVKKEVVLASEYKIPLVPVRIENVLPSGAFRYQLTTRNYLDLFQDWDTNLARLTEQLAHLVAANGNTSSTDARIPNDDAAVELAFWESVRESRNPEELATYIREFPNGRFLKLAQLRMDLLARAPRQDGAGGTPAVAAHGSSGNDSSTSHVELEHLYSHVPLAPRQPSPPPGPGDKLPPSATPTNHKESGHSTSMPIERGIEKPVPNKEIKIAVASCATATFVIGVILMKPDGDHGNQNAVTPATVEASAAAPDAVASSPAPVSALPGYQPAAPPLNAQRQAQVTNDGARRDGQSGESKAEQNAARPAQPAVVDHGGAVLSVEDRRVLDNLADKVKQINLEVVIVTGHTDASAGAKYGDRLSIRRAESIKAYLHYRGIESNRIYTEGKGGREPVARQDTPDAPRLNNRVEIEVVGTSKDTSGQKITYKNVVHF